MQAAQHKYQIKFSLFMYRMLNLLVKPHFTTRVIAWNGLPQHIQSVLNISQFKCLVKRFLFSYLNDQEDSSFIYF